MMNDLMDNFSQDSIESPTVRADVERSLYQKKYYALKRRCEQVQQNNEKLVNRIHYVKKIIKRYKKERRFLMNRLDNHGDKYRDALVPAMWEEHFQPSPLLPTLQSRTDQPSVKISSGKKSSVKSENEGAVKQKKKRKTGMKGGVSKKPVNAFLMFCQNRRASLQAEYMKENNKDLSQQDLTKRLSQEWRNLSQEDKKIFYDKYEAEKERLEGLKRLGLSGTPINANISMHQPLKMDVS